MPFPLGSFGEGFVKDLTAQPVWDLRAPTPFVLYKGSRVPYMKVNGYASRGHTRFRDPSPPRCLPPPLT